MNTIRDKAHAKWHTITLTDFALVIGAWVDNHSDQHNSDAYKYLSDLLRTNELENNYDSKGEPIIFDFDDLAYYITDDKDISLWCRECATAALLPNITDIQRGDIINYNFLKYCCTGTHFWTGTELLYHHFDNNNDLYGTVPPDFLSITEFPIWYFHGCVHKNIHWLDYDLFHHQVRKENVTAATQQLLQANSNHCLRVTYNNATYEVPFYDRNGIESLYSVVHAVESGASLWANTIRLVR